VTRTPGPVSSQVDAVAPDQLVAVLRGHGLQPGGLLGVAWSPYGVGLAHAGRLLACEGPAPSTTAALREVVAGLRPRLVWWSAREAAPLLGGAGAGPTTWVPSTWDVGASHRLLHGGSAHEPALVWAVARGLDPEDRPRTGQLDLLAGGPDAGDPADPEEPVRPDGHLRPGWSTAGPPTPRAAARWAALALEVQAAHAAALGSSPDGRPAAAGPRLAVLTAWSESAAELLAVELGLRGLPLDRAVAEELVAERVGPRPADAAQAAELRAGRDDAVRRLVPGGDRTDLRNPAQVRELLARVGIDVPDTRSGRLEPFRGTHPVVGALLDWRKAERIATTYGFGWLDRDLGADGRLRGQWTGCDGAAGRMTASAGLHNMPAELRPAVAAEPGHLLVRADLGQVEPRVLAAVSGDAALARATADDDLYAPVAARLGVERPVAKVAVLAAMYGQTSGAAGEALRGLERAYPVAMGYLRTAHEAGAAGTDVHTYGGRRVRMWRPADEVEPAVAAARGRFARNAVVQGAAAELFKMWAVSVRAALPAGAEIVLCLHDELLVQVPEGAAPEVVELLHRVLAGAAGRWAAGSGVRFVADVAVVRRWSDAKA
jgi:DNA polymerase-1